MAFVLNAMANMIIVVFSIAVKDAFDNEIEVSGSIPVTMLFTFIASMATYWLLYLLFGFGGGMLANQ